MSAWRLGCVAILLLGLWQLMVGFPSWRPAKVAPLPAAAAAQAAASTLPQASWSTAGDSSFAAQPSLSLGLSPLEQPNRAASSDWDRRLSDARSEQLRLQALPGLTPRQREAALQAHLQQHFSAAERARVEAGLQLMSR